MELNIDYNICVALRRIIMQNMPHYCFEEIIMHENNTLLDNDHIKKRISNIPIKNIFIDLKNLKKIDEDLLIHNDYLKKITNIDELKMECKKKYDVSKKEILQEVSTNDCVFTLNNKKIKNPYKNKIKIVDLKYNDDSIYFTAKTNLNIPLKDVKYSNTETVILLPQQKNSLFKIYPKLESMTPKMLIQNAKYILKLKLDNILEEIKSVDTDNGRIVLNHDIFTLNYLLSFYLEKHSDIDFCSTNLNSLVEKNGHINFVLKKNSKKKIHGILKEINNYIHKQLEIIK